MTNFGEFILHLGSRLLEAPETVVTWTRRGMVELHLAPTQSPKECHPSPSSRATHLAKKEGPRPWVTRRASFSESWGRTQHDEYPMGGTTGWHTMRLSRDPPPPPSGSGAFHSSWCSQRPTRPTCSAARRSPPPFSARRDEAMDSSSPYGTMAELLLTESFQKYGV